MTWKKFSSWSLDQTILEAQLKITGKAKSRRAVWLLPNFVKSRPPGCDCKRHTWHAIIMFYFKICQHSFFFFRKICNRTSWFSNKNTFSLRLSVWVWEPIMIILSGSFSSLFLNVEYDSELPTIDFSASFINNMKGESLLSLHTAWSKQRIIFIHS